MAQGPSGVGATAGAKEGVWVLATHRHGIARAPGLPRGPPGLSDSPLNVSTVSWGLAVKA